MKKHRPLHIHQDTSIIFLTGRTYSGTNWLAPEETKQYFLDKLSELVQKHKFALDAYVICSNHYHLLLAVPNGAEIPKFVKNLHGSTAHFIKQNTPELVSGDQVLSQKITAWDIRQRRRMNSANARGGVLANFLPPKEGLLHSRLYDPEVIALTKVKDAPIWYQYMDHIVRSDEDYYKHINYIHQNPVKHGYANKLTDYKWSSIHKWVKEKGKEYVLDCFRTYPIVDFEPIAE